MALREKIVFLEYKISHFGFKVLGHPVLVGKETTLAFFSPLFCYCFRPFVNSRNRHSFVRTPIKVNYRHEIGLIDDPNK